jgi:hypothetical protein
MQISINGDDGGRRQGRKLLLNQGIRDNGGSRRFHLFNTVAAKRRTPQTDLGFPGR